MNGCYNHLQDLLDSIGILSTGHLPLLLFPPTVLQNVTANAIEMVTRLTQIMT